MQNILSLIQTIRRYDEPLITISAQGKLYSSASLLYFYMLFNKDDDKLKHVTTKSPDSELSIMLHRVNRYCDPDELKDIFYNPTNAEDYDIDATGLFTFNQKGKFAEDLFNIITRFFERIEKTTTQEIDILNNLRRAKKIYRSNKDLYFSYTPELDELVRMHL